MVTKQLATFIEFSSTRLTKKIIHGDDNILTFVLNLEPGQILPRHGHEHGTLVIQVLQGAGTIIINDEQAALVAGSLYFLGGTDMLEVPLVTAPLSVLVTIAPNPSNPIYRQPR